MVAKRASIIWMNDHPNPFLSIGLLEAFPSRRKKWLSTLALIDTGSFISAMASTVLSDLQPAIAGSRDVSSHLGSSSEPIYRAVLRLTDIPNEATPISMMEMAHPLGIHGVEALLGMDFIATGRLYLDRGQSSFFEYRD